MSLDQRMKKQNPELLFVSKRSGKAIQDFNMALEKGKSISILF